MQIQKVQSYQTTFGTKVQFEPTAVQIIQARKKGRIVLKQAKTLAQNGINDVFYISRYGNNMEYPPQIVGSVLEQKDGITYISRYSVHSNVNTGINIIDIYEKARGKMDVVREGKNSLSQFIEFLT